MEMRIWKKCFGPIVYCHFDRPWLGYIFWSRYPMQLFCINFHYSSNLRTHLPICTKYFIQPFQTRSYMSGKKWGTNLHTVYFVTVFASVHYGVKSSLKLDFQAVFKEYIPIHSHPNLWNLIVKLHIKMTVNATSKHVWPHCSVVAFIIGAIIVN